MRPFPHIFSALLCLLLALPTGARVLDEASVKAAFIYNFTKFTEWPTEDAASPLQFCVVGEEADPLLIAVMNLEGKHSQGRNIQVRNIVHKPDRYAGCHVIIVGANEAASLAVILGTAQRRAALTVSEIDHFVDAGGMIGLVVDGTRVRFEINALAAQQSGLTFSSQLLKLARRLIK